MDCDECRWFDSQKIEADRFNHETKEWSFTHVGICRRHCPTRTVFPDNGHVVSGWPQVDSADWCGDWEEVIDNVVPKDGEDEASEPKEFLGKPGRRMSDCCNDNKRIRAVVKNAREKKMDTLGHSR